MRRTIVHALLALLAPLALIVALLPAQAAPGAAPSPAVAAPPAGLETATPAYYYDRETAFLLNYAIDPVFGGLFSGLNADGSLIPDLLPETVWGFQRGLIRGTDKSHIAQATCIRYFIIEYQRIETTGVGVAGINALLTRVPPLTSAEDLLTRGAANCADFVIDNMVIPAGPPPPQNTTFLPTGRLPVGSHQGNTQCYNRLYYWGFASREGDGTPLPGDVAAGFVDDTFKNGGLSAARTESIIPWSMAELALILRDAGIPSWTRYRDAARSYWDWRKTTATEMVPYRDAATPTTDTLCQGPGANEVFTNNAVPGIGRDAYYSALGMALAELFPADAALYLNGDQSFNGGLNFDGKPNGAIPFANRWLVPPGSTADAPSAPYLPAGDSRENTMQDGAYGSGFGRAILFAKHDEANLGPLAQRDQWQDFGWFPGITLTDNSVVLPPFAPGDPVFGDANLGVPFAHLSGRELLAGVQRAHWFFYTYGVNPQIFYAAGGAPNLQKQNFGQGILEFWNFTNTKLWDNTPGVAAWFEALGLPYKPCFAGGTDVPLGDWLAPTIADKVHSPNQPTPSDAVTVTVSGVEDPSFPYLSWSFDGSGVDVVQVVFSIDGGATWTILDATPTGTPGIYTAVIPPQPSGVRVDYYARVRDRFNNWTAFPAGAETWTSAGGSTTSVGQTNVANAQFYVPFEFTAITLASFTARPAANGVQVSWTTTSEVNTQAFHLLRSTAGRDAAERVTTQAIPALGQGGGGASYTFLDTSAEPGVSYRYWLEEIEVGGQTREYGPTAAAEIGGGHQLFIPIAAR